MPAGEFGKKVVIDPHRCRTSCHLRHPTSGPTPMTCAKLALEFSLGQVQYATAGLFLGDSGQVLFEFVQWQSDGFRYCCVRFRLGHRVAYINHSEIFSSIHSPFQFWDSDSRSVSHEELLQRFPASVGKASEVESMCRQLLSPLSNASISSCTSEFSFVGSVSLVTAAHSWPVLLHSVRHVHLRSSGSVCSRMLRS